MWSKRKSRNRRLGRVQVLDVKMRSSRVMAARTRMAAMAFGVCFGTIFGLYVVWRAGEWTLNKLVYTNKSFAIQRLDIQTDGVISVDQIRRWSGVKAGDNLLALDLSRVKRNLEMAPMIESVSIERILPGTLRMRVGEREPLAQVNVAHPSPNKPFDQIIFQLDPEGYVLVPLDPRQREVPLTRGEDQFPAISGINALEMQPGRRIVSGQAKAALQFIQAFNNSSMANLADLRSVDVSSPGVLVVTTRQGSEVTFGLDDFDRQLAYWHRVYQECLKYGKTIATLDLAVADNSPLLAQDPGPVPPPAPRSAKPHRSRKSNV